MRILITGGAGFVGANLSFFLNEMGYDVTALDNLARRGSETNLEEFKKKGIRFIHGDIRNPEDFYNIKADIVLECSAQPSATDGYNNPKYDITNNLYGAINVLEYARINGAAVILWSTNKVYSGDRINAIPMREEETRYVWDGIVDRPGFDPAFGFSDSFDVDGGQHSIYGMTKIQADIACQEYYDAFGVPTVVNRFSCVSGEELILTATGYRKLKDVKKGEYLHTTEGWSATSTGAIFTGNKNTIRIRTKSGYSVVITEDHKMYTPSGYIPLKNIPYGGFVEIVPELNTPSIEKSSSVILSEESFTEKFSNCNHFKNGFIKKSATYLKSKGLLDLRYDSPVIEQLTKLVGYCFGDAHIQFLKNKRKDNGKNTVRITTQIYDKEDENLLEIKRFIEQTLGFKCSKITTSKSTSVLYDGSVISGTSKKITVCSAAFSFFMHTLGVPKGKKSDSAYNVPKWVLNGPLFIKSAFLSGYLGAEGRCPGLSEVRRNGETDVDLTYLSVTQCKSDKIRENGELFAAQIRALFKEFDIDSTLYKTKVYKNKKGENRRGYEVRLGQSKDTYKKMLRIGFAFNRKRLRELLTINEFLKTNLPFSEFTSWRKIHTSGCSYFGVWDQLIDRAPAGKLDVYDMTVPDTSSFIVSNFHVHNCLAGPRQWGKCAQGWVAWFAVAAEFGFPIDFIGWKGKQVRDVLFAEDICSLIAKEIDRIGSIGGQVFNVGGGMGCNVSLIEAVAIVEEGLGKKIKTRLIETPRKADHCIYITDTRKAQKMLDWSPKVRLNKGYAEIMRWVRDNKDVLSRLYL